MAWHSWSRLVIDWSIRVMIIGLFSRRIPIQSNAFLIRPRIIRTTTLQLQKSPHQHHWKQHRSASKRAPTITSLWSSTAPPQSPWIDSTDSRNKDDEEGRETYSRPVVQWYPGHIAKAERLLRETFQAVDVVVEVRDARACHATSHPKVEEWVSNRPRIVVFTHTDLVSSVAMRNWKEYYEQLESNNDQSRVANFIWVNAKHGQGIPALHRAIFKAGAHVQERRMRRGLKDRPLRVGIMGYPNVGKSALINRLLGRRRAKSSNTPGVTRSLQWIRVRTEDGKKTHKREYELLDSPGIIPASLEDQSEALLLSACNCIGEAAYDNQVVAAYLIQWLQNLCFYGREKACAPEWRDNCNLRYGIDPLKSFPMEEVERDHFFMPFEDSDNDETATNRFLTGEEILVKVANNKCRGNLEDAARKVLQDFRMGRMGAICLQIPSQDNVVVDPRMGTRRGNVFGPQTESMEWQTLQEKMELEKQNRLRSARQRADEQGLELPPSIISNDENTDNDDNDKGAPNSEVGKGLFEGW